MEGAHVSILLALASLFLLVGVHTAPLPYDSTLGTTAEEEQHVRRALLNLVSQSTPCCGRPPSREDCLFALPGNAPDCQADAVDVEAQARYFKKYWFPQYRNGPHTETLAPAVVFNPRLANVKLSMPDAVCNGQELLQSMRATNAEAGRVCHLFDVGANVGEYAEWLLKHSPRHCHVYSYEPAPTTYEVLKKTARKHSRITALNKAVSDSVGNATISFGEAGDLGASIGELARATHHAVVPQVTLELEIAQVKAAQQIPFIKIDVESFELHVLRGLNESLSTRRARSVLWEHNIKKHRCGCGQRDESRPIYPECGCVPKSTLRQEVDFLASYGYHIFLPGTKKFLRIDGSYWRDIYEVDLHTHRGPKTPVINILAVAPGDPMLAYIVERLQIRKGPGVFNFDSPP